MEPPSSFAMVFPKSPFHKKHRPVPCRVDAWLELWKMVKGGEGPVLPSNSQGLGVNSKPTKGTLHYPSGPSAPIFGAPSQAFAACFGTFDAVSYFLASLHCWFVPEATQPSPPLAI